MLAIFDRTNNMRFFQAISTVESWCAEHGKACVRVGPNDLSTLSERGVAALYCVVGHDLGYLEGLDPKVKLVIDHDIVDPSVRFRNDEVLTNRSFAFRRAFGGKVVYEPEMQTPYVHVPQLPETWAETASVRDVLVFDLHRWLPVEAHFSFLALMHDVGRRHNIHSKILGRRLFLYMTGLIRAELYHDTAECFQFLNNCYHHPDAFRSPLAVGTKQRWSDLFSRAIDADASGSEVLDLKNPDRNAMDVFIKNVIPPLRDRAEFAALFARVVGFVTDHGDIADQDVSTCLAMGIPVVTLPRSPWRKSAGVGTTLSTPLRMIDPAFAASIDDSAHLHQMPSDGLDTLLETGPLPPVPVSLFNSVYSKTWEMLFDWIETGAKNVELSAAIDSSPRWDFGML